MDRKYSSRRKINLPVLITVTSIGVLLCLSGALLMILDVGPFPMRISLGVIGLFLLATSSPFARTISP